VSGLDAGLACFDVVNKITYACKIVGCARLTHDSLRHLFATRCADSGIGIPTVAGQLGHNDGGCWPSRFMAIFV
jgi:integrase